MKHFLLLLIFFNLFNSCKTQNQKADIIVTIYPIKFILDEIVKDQLNIEVLLPPAVDPHTYELVPSDLIKAKQAKLFIYIDKDLDSWAAKIDSKNKIQLSDLLHDSLKLFFTQPEIEFNNNIHHNHQGFDPHFWIDPLTVKNLIFPLVNLLSLHYPDKEKHFLDNAKNFSLKLDSLHNFFYAETKSIKNKNIFSSHPFFDYFFRRYNFNIVGFLQLTPGQNISPKELQRIIELVKLKNVNAIFTDRQQDNKTTKMLAEISGINSFELDPIGGTENINNFTELLIYNFQIIRQALN